MKKKSCFFSIVILLFCIIVFSACNDSNAINNYPINNDGEESERSDADTEPIYVALFTFEEPDDDILMQGFLSTAKTDNRAYFFPIDDEIAKLAFLESTEQLINEIESRFNLGSPPDKIFMTDGAEHYRLRTGIATINHDDINTAGWLVHAWGDGHIPIWLSAGMETGARVKLGLYEPGTNMIDILNELPFSPLYWGSMEHIEAIDTAYHFVSYLYESGRLSELIELYVNSERTAADAMTLELFSSFLGTSFTDTIVNFELMGLPWGVAYRIVATTMLSNYIFEFSEFDEYLGMTQLSLVDYIYTMDNAIAFTKNWFYNHLPYLGVDDFSFYPMDVHLRLGESTRIPWAGGYEINRNSFAIYMLDSFTDGLHHHLARAASHEAAHVISWRLERNRLLHIHEESIANALSGGFRRHITFEEGLATAIHTLFLRQYHPQFADETIAHLIGDITLLEFEGFRDKPFDMWSDSELLRLYDAAGSTVEDLDNKDIIEHLQAYAILNHFEILPESFREQIEKYRTHFARWSPIPYANCYDTSVSFVLFLIESYGSKMFMLSHSDPTSFEDIYGINVYDMIERWKDFLSDMVESLVTEAMHNFGV